MSAATGDIIVGFGAGAADFYRPVGQVESDHIPGAKITEWGEREDALLTGMLDNQHEYEMHVGGNALNVLAYLACRTVAQEVGFVSVLGENDLASTAIRSHLGKIGITDLTLTANGYLPSISIIERARPGSDRMVRGRPRGPLGDFLTVEHIRATAGRANVVVAASLKDPEATSIVFESTPKNAFLDFNPGSSEFVDYRDELHDLMQMRRPNLLALNDDELRLLCGADSKSGIEELARKSSIEFADHVLCTLGKDGILLAWDGAVIHEPAAYVPADRIVDTLGAGDRANAITIAGLRAGKCGRPILRDVANGTARLVQYTGAHGDLA